MEPKFFVNLPVKDLKRSVDFFTKLGFTFNPQFTDRNGACMIINQSSFVMLLAEKFFISFTKKEITETAKSAEILLSYSAESKEKVDELVSKAFESGGKKYCETLDHGWMYQRNFQDPDGHLWEVFCMNMSEFQKRQTKKKVNLV